MFKYLFYFVLLCLSLSCKKKENNQLVTPVIPPIPNTPPVINTEQSLPSIITSQLLYGRFDHKYMTSNDKMVFGNDGSLYILTKLFVDTGSLGDEVLLIKATNGGNEIWRRSFGSIGSDKIGAIIISNDGGIIVGSNWFPNPNNYSNSLRLTKFSTEGNLIYDKKYNYGNTDLMSIAEFDNGNIIAFFQYSERNSNILYASSISKFSAKGDSVSTVVYKDYMPASSSQSQIVAHSNGSIYFSAKSRKQVSTGTYSETSAIVKLDGSLNFLKEILMDSLQSDNETRLISLKSQGEAIIALGSKDYKRKANGTLYHGYYTPVFLKINSADQIEIRKESKKYTDDYAAALVATPSGFTAFIMGTITYGNVTAHYPYFAILDQQGNTTNTVDFLDFTDAPLDMIRNGNGEYLIASVTTLPDFYSALQITRFK